MYVAPADQRILTGSAGTLELTLRDADGDPDTTTTTITVAVDRGDGSELLAAGTVTTQSGSKHTVALTRAQTATPDRLTCTWSSSSDVVATTTVDLVGAHWFSLAELRNRRGVAKRSDDELRAARDAWADLADRVTGVAWVPRWGRETFRHHGGRRIVPEWAKVRSVVSCVADGATIDVSDWELDAGGGVIITDTEIGHVEVVLTYLHGYDRPPQPLIDAGLEFCEWHLTGDRNGISPRALGFTAADGGTYRYASASVDNPTGLPDVDAMLRTYSRRLPGIA